MIILMASGHSGVWPSSAAALSCSVTNRLLLSVVTRETAEPPGANGHHFRQASEGRRPRPRSWTLYRYAHRASEEMVTYLLTTSARPD